VRELVCLFTCCAVAADLTKRCKPGRGYTVTVQVHSLDAVPATMYRTWSEWMWDFEPACTTSDLQHASQ
jgi:hypothetical protein